jgi:hypothetical protein
MDRHPDGTACNHHDRCAAAVTAIHKISRVSGTPSQPVEQPFAYDNTFVAETLADGTPRLKVGLRGGHSRALIVLGGAFQPSYKILYVLHTSRTRSPLGRYESPALSAAEVEAFCERFGTFLAEDARHDVWLRAREPEGTIVLDRYNMVYVYGPLDRAAGILRNGGVQEVATWAAPEVPYPHALHYHAEFDEAERAILQVFDWQRTPLSPDDVQYWTGPHAT